MSNNNLMQAKDNKTKVVVDTKTQNDKVETHVVETKPTTQAVIVPSPAESLVPAPHDVDVTAKVAVEFPQCTPDEVTTLKLIQVQVDYYCENQHRGCADNSPKTVENFTNLHAAFRGMMNLTGKAHQEAAKIFIKAFAKYGTTALDYDLRCRRLDSLPREWRVVFTKYLDALNRFQRSSDKANFRNSYNLDGLLSKIENKDLIDAVNSVFPQ